MFFSASGHLYMRDTAARKTVQVDIPEPECHICGGGADDPEFQFASSDGSRVFFTDTEKLTAEAEEYPSSRGGADGGDLYVCEVHDASCVLKDLAPAGAVLGSLLGASEDGSWVYFVANGRLAPGAVVGTCGGPRGNAACDLYVEHYDAGAEAWEPPTLVGVLSGADAPDWSPGLVGLTARVSPNGEYVAFMSQRSLTGYDDRDVVSGVPDEEVYLFDGQSDRLVCASCDPTGARPHGAEYGGGGDNMPLVAGGGGVWPPHTWLAASIPTWTRYTLVQALYQSRYLSDAGRLFFNASDGLVPKDVNGTWDVYEYEPEGVPSGVRACSIASGSGGVVYKPERSAEVEARDVQEGAGCVGLISSGSSGEESAFLDASTEGSDVFFLSTGKLSPLDSEGGLTVYDAHECTSGSPCIAPPAAQPPACTTEASCKAAPSPQPSIYSLPASATFSGPGNLVVPPHAPVATTTKKTVKCKKKLVKNRKGKCVKRKKKAKKTSRASGGRAARP